MNVLEVNSLVLAYLGDSVYENYVRDYLIKSGINHVKELQEESLNFVSAKSQARILKELINKQVFTEEELVIIKRARNAKTNSHPKNTDIITYKEATSLEAIIGYLKLKNNIERIEELMDIIFQN
ncbi:MAG: ribonuclease III [Bacilli bacterium]|nr:ribonuclease III [Bacilli bacterium]